MLLKDPLILELLQRLQMVGSRGHFLQQTPFRTNRRPIPDPDILWDGGNISVFDCGLGQICAASRCGESMAQMGASNRRMRFA